jgi:hypothetical protein
VEAAGIEIDGFISMAISCEKSFKNLPAPFFITRNTSSPVKCHPKPHKVDWMLRTARPQPGQARQFQTLKTGV